MQDMMHHNSTRVAFLLASPGNRRSTANGGYDSSAFDKMVRSRSYAPLLSKGTYEVLNHREVSSQFTAMVKLNLANGSTCKYQFVMSLIPPDVEDTNPALAPYQLHRGHPWCWRTDSVMPSRY
jgi:hypothetical protein